MDSIVALGTPCRDVMTVKEIPRGVLKQTFARTWNIKKAIKGHLNGLCDFKDCGFKTLSSAEAAGKALSVMNLMQKGEP